MQFASFSLKFEQLLDKLKYIIWTDLSYIDLELVFFDQSEVDQVIDETQQEVYLVLDEL